MRESMDRNQMTETEYLLYLRSQQEEMKADILKLCSRKQEPCFLPEYQVYLGLEGKYHLDRIGENGADVILLGVCRNLLGTLAAKGQLEESEEGAGYRTKEGAQNGRAA